MPSLSVVLYSLSLCLVPLTGSEEVTTVLSSDTDLVLPQSSSNDVVFHCTVEGDVNEYSPLWVISGRQTRSNSSGKFIIEPSSDGSQLTVTMAGRELIGRDVITIMCHADSPVLFRLVLGTQTLNIILFDTAGPVEGLELVYHNESHLMLQWFRPKDLHPQVSVTYSVIINNTDTATIEQSYNITSTLVAVDQSRTDSCTLHSFSVTPITTAGTSPSTTISHSIPISLNITSISLSQKVTAISLSSTTPTITISFNPASSCGARFPVLNHTVRIEGLQGEVLLTDETVYEELITFSLNSTIISGLRLDQISRIIITACTQLTCLSPSLPLIAVTTDTQKASVVFYLTAISLNCSFATGSSARGCLFVFRLTNKDATENVTVSYSGSVGSNSSCGQLSNTRGAYDEEVLVYDIESNGSIGSQPISAIVIVDEVPDNFTCPLPTIEITREVLSKGAIGGIVASVIIAVIFIIFCLGLAIAFCVLVRRERRNNKTWPDSATNATNIIIRAFDPTRWNSTDGPNGEDDFTPGREDKDVTISNIAVMVMNNEGRDSISIEPLQCTQTTELLSTLKARKNGYVRLYPEEL